MKCITYVSKVIASENGALIPSDLTGIFRTARKRNHEYNITGTLSYSKGYYIQAIEGDAEKVDQLFSNIKNDPRHQHVVVLIDVEITRRSFANWDMKLLQSTRKSAEFMKFIGMHSNLIADMNPLQQKLLGIFCMPDKIAKSNDRPANTNKEPTDAVTNYDGKDLKMTSWPGMVEIQATPPLINLCATLIKSSVPYKHLIENNEYGSRQQLDETLRLFDSLDILVVTESENHTPTANASNQSNGFYNKMKNFLGFQS